MNGEMSDGAVLVVVVSAEGIPLVRDPEHSNPRWKLPGGGVEKGETHADAAHRELKEETGLNISIDDDDRIDCISKKDHIKTIYHVDVYFLKGLCARGEEGEEVEVFSLNNARRVIIDDHRKYLEPPYTQ